MVFGEEVNLAPADEAINQQLMASRAKPLDVATLVAPSKVADLTGLRSLLGYSALRNQAPNLRFDSGGLGQGLGNALNNFMQMRAFGQNKRLQQNMAEMATQQMEEEQLRAQQEQQASINRLNMIREKYGEEGAIAYATDPKAFIGKRLIPVFETQAKVDAFKQNYQNPEEQVQQQDGRIASVPTPMGIDRNRFVFGSEPTTSLDINKKLYENKTAELGVQMKQLQLEQLPKKLEQETRSGDLKIEQQDLENQIKSIQAQYEPQMKALEAQGKYLTNAKTAEALAKAQEGKQFFDNLLNNIGAIDFKNPKTLQHLTLQAARHGYKLTIPGSTYEAIRMNAGENKQQLWVVDKVRGTIVKRYGQ